MQDVYTSEYTIPQAIMRLAIQWAQDRSKDPRTKVGAVVYDETSGAAILGYNGFNAGMPDLKAIWDNRDPEDPACKYNYVRHAEANALEKAFKLIGDLSGCYLAVTHFPCFRCMKDWIIPSGIKTVYYLDAHDNDQLTHELAARHKIELVPLVFDKKPEEAEDLVEDKRVFVTRHAADRFMERFPVHNALDARRATIRTLLGIYYNSEITQQTGDTCYRQAIHRGNGETVTLVCTERPDVILVTTVLTEAMAGV